MSNFTISSITNDGYPTVIDVTIAFPMQILCPLMTDMWKLSGIFEDDYPMRFVDLAKPYVLVYPPSIALWRVSDNINDGYPYTSLEYFPLGWINPYLDWTFQSNFDIVRDFGRISNNINYLRGSLFLSNPLKLDWKYSDKVYKSYLTNFVYIINGLIDVYGVVTPKITVPDKFDYTILQSIEIVSFMIYSKQLEINSGTKN